MSTNHPIFVSVETSAYSGATLLSFLLGAHPHIATIGEMNGLIASEDPHEYLCSCGKKIAECEFWQAVGTAMHNRGFEFAVADFGNEFEWGEAQFIRRLRRGSFGNNTLDLMRDAVFFAWPGETRQLKKVVARNEAFVESILAVTAKKVFVDTSKDFLRSKYLSKFSKFDVRVIHLIRDVRGVVTSRLRRKEDANAYEVAKVWVKQNCRIQRLLKTLPEGKYTTVRYEDLCQNPLSTLEHLYDFCGAGTLDNSDTDSITVDFRLYAHHIVGNVMRLGYISEIKLDERWKTSLTEAQLAEIDRAAGVLNRRYTCQ